MRFAAEACELGVPVFEESDRATEVSVGVVVEADGHLDDPLEERLEVALRFSPAALEKLVDLEEQSCVEERSRCAKRPGDPAGASRGGAAPISARRQRLDEPRRSPTQRLEVGGEVAAEPNALAGPLEEPGAREDASLVRGKPCGGAASRGLPRECGERLDRRLGRGIHERGQTPFGETIPQNELHLSGHQRVAGRFAARLTGQAILRAATMEW